MIQFYAPDIEATGLLPEADSAHCCRVLRMREGDTVYVVDGRGRRHECIILEAHQKRTSVEIVATEELDRTWPADIVLAVSPTKHMDRMEWMAEKAVEIGVDRIAFIRCERSERKEIKPERVEKVMVSAMKQSLKAVLPLTGAMEDLRTFVESLPEGVQRFFGYCSPELPKADFTECYEAGKPVVLLIGPEGDFAPQEVEYLVGNGFRAVTFGPSRLRTETAALYGLTAIHVVDGMGARCAAG